MGLPFLNKKSWHTGSFKNIEQVWIAEEEFRERKKKQEELRKKLIEEKYNEQLKKLQVEAGLLPRSALDKMDWMYNYYGHEEAENKTEEYLLGKPVESLGEDETVNQLKNKARRFEDNLEDRMDEEDDANEDFAKLQDDPLFQIKKEELARKQQILNNPLRMKEILKELQIREKLHKKKKKKKDKKKKSKKRKSKSKSRHRSDSSSSTEKTGLKKTERKTSTKKDRKRRGSSSSLSSNDATRSRSRSKSKSSRKKKQKKEKKEKKKKSKRDKSRTTSASSHNEDDMMFNDFVKKRLGPLVDYDEDTYRLRFTARHKFKNNDRKKMTKKEQEDLVEAMKRNADMYQKKKLEAHMLQLEETDEQEKRQESKGNANFLQEFSKKAILEGGNINSLAENLNRGKYFHDQDVGRRDDSKV